MGIYWKVLTLFMGFVVRAREGFYEVFSLSNNDREEREEGEE